MNQQSKLQYHLESFLSALGVIIRAFILTFLMFVLLESSLNYRTKPTSLKPYILQYNFTNNENQENTLVVMS